MSAWYNENDPHAAAWLRELIAQGHLPQGEVDETSIVDVFAEDCEPTSHFFAGIGGWPLALELAGWPADRPVWTGSCPCQPFSAAGKRKGHEDERHLWPEWLRLITECRPPTIFGEQVASADGRDWLAGVRRDLEALGYAVGAADLCAAGIGAPHIRQRLWWVAVAQGVERNGTGDEGRGWGELANSRTTGRLGHTPAPRLQGSGSEFPRWGSDEHPSEPSSRAGGVADSRSSQRCGGEDVHLRRGRQDQASTLNPWTPYEAIPCLDNRARRIEPGSFPLATRIPARVVRLRGYGNAIVPQVAAQFIRAALEATPQG